MRPPRPTRYGATTSFSRSPSATGAGRGAGAGAHEEVVLDVDAAARNSSIAANSIAIPETNMVVDACFLDGQKPQFDSAVSKNSTNEIGLPKIWSTTGPSARTTDWRKPCSAIGPRINPSTIGAGEKLAEIGEMVAAGAVGISDDGKPVMNGQLMRRAMEYSTRPIFMHAEDASVSRGGVCAPFRQPTGPRCD